jgi:acyl transferase
MTTTAAHLEVDEIEMTAPDGGRLAVWRMTSQESSVRRGPILLLPGFGRRMRHMAVIARHLAENGFVVYRSDLRNHVGLSDGDIEQFSMTEALEGICAVAGKVIEAESVPKLIVVAASLSFRLAIRMAARDENVSGIIGLVGVVDTRYTLSQAFETDFFALPRPDWPTYAQFEKYRISSATFGPDCVDENWLERDDCIDELGGVQCYVTNFCGGNDKWVRIEDIRRAFASGRDAGRVLVEMPDAEHELARNPVAVNNMLRDVALYALKTQSVDGSHKEDVCIVDLSFDAMAAQTIFERRYESEARERQAVEML